MDILRGHGEQSAVTKTYCQAERAACSTLVCTKLDALQNTVRQMDVKREEARNEISDMRIHLAKIAQFLEDKNGAKIG